MGKQHHTFTYESIKVVVAKAVSLYGKVRHPASPIQLPGNTHPSGEGLAIFLWKIGNAGCDWSEHALEKTPGNTHLRAIRRVTTWGYES